MAGKIMLKFLLGAGILIIVFSLVMIVGSMVLLNANHNAKEEVMFAVDGAGKALIVYQPSLTGASGDVARWIGEGLNERGYEVTLNRPVAGLSADAYDVIVLGGPVYAGKLSAVLPEYAAAAGDVSGKTVILFSTMGSTSEGPEAMPEFDRLRDTLQGVEPYAVVQFKFNDSEVNQEKAYRLGMDAAER